VTRRTLTTVSERLLRVPEVARILAIEGTEVYGLIERGELEAGKGADGLVYVAEQAVRAYEERRAGAST
jgi:helix-turn-helix protein